MVTIDPTHVTDTRPEAAATPRLWWFLVIGLNLVLATTATMLAIWLMTGS